MSALVNVCIVFFVFLVGYTVEPLKYYMARIETLLKLRRCFLPTLPPRLPPQGTEKVRMRKRIRIRMYSYKNTMFGLLTLMKRIEICQKIINT